MTFLAVQNETVPTAAYIFTAIHIFVFFILGYNFPLRRNHKTDYLITTLFILFGGLPYLIVLIIQNPAKILTAHDYITPFVFMLFFWPGVFCVIDYKNEKDVYEKVVNNV